jgi:hypothetical protein
MSEFIGCDLNNAQIAILIQKAKSQDTGNFRAELCGIIYELFMMK